MDGGILTNNRGRGELMYYILSLKRSKGERLLWWRPNSAGYTYRLDDAGVYEQQVIDDQPEYYDNKESTMAIPIAVAQNYARKEVPGEFFNQLVGAARYVRKNIQDNRTMQGDS